MKAQTDLSAKEVELLENLANINQRINDEIHKVIVGQDDIIEQLIIALFAKGHCLLVGVPGLAKTLLINTVARVLDLKFNRIQFTPDLMPSDITGTEIIEESRATGTKEFRFIRGPIFANIVLADEINRTPPKTQAALLEAMQEHKVTAGGVDMPLEQPFFVLATQNPIEQEGTYPLPEAQLDRFMFNLWIDYPSFDEEVKIVMSTTGGASPDLQKIMNAEDIIACQNVLRNIPVSQNVIEYAVRMANLSRPGYEKAPDFVKKWVNWGAGPRASQYLVLGAKTRAALQGRFTPSEADVRACAIPVLRHRIVTNFNAEAEGITTMNIIEKLFEYIS
jgi:MoxR-like ATPase